MSITRRKFLALTGAAVAGVTVGVRPESEPLVVTDLEDWQDDIMQQIAASSGVPKRLLLGEELPQWEGNGAHVSWGTHPVKTALQNIEEMEQTMLDAGLPGQPYRLIMSPATARRILGADVL